MITHNKLKWDIALKVSNSFNPALNAEDTLNIYRSLGKPPQSELGDFALGCFQLAKKLQKKPQELAQEISQLIKDHPDFQSAIAAGPYLNIQISPEIYGKLLLEPILSGEFFKGHFFEAPQKTMVEFSQPNTHKELHVGHMRNLCLGESLVRLLRYSGVDVISSTFPGDMGTHVAKCLWYMKKVNQEPPPLKKKGEWLGKMYSKAHNYIESKEGTDEGAQIKTDLTEILKSLENQSGSYFELWKETRIWSIDLMKEVYAWAEVSFDEWYFESEMDSPSLAWVQELYSQGLLEKSQGAIGKNLEEEKLGFCLLQKSDGTGLYATKDLLLAKHKFEHKKIEKSIYIVDMRQALHFKQIFRTLEILGFPQAKDCFHLQYNYVELPDGAMSSRKGNIVPLLLLVSEMEAHVKENYLHRYKDQWTEAEIDSVAKEVAKGAIFYGMVKMDSNKKIIFDMKEWLNLDGDSGPFIQYSHARIESLLRKFPLDLTEASVPWSMLNHPLEKQLLQTLSGFNSEVEIAALNLKPSIICTLIYDIAKKFNAFYHECPIGTESNQELKKARLALSKATGLVLKKGLFLVGMPAPQRM